jgi:hypothetical protein
LFWVVALALAVVGGDGSIKIFVGSAEVVGAFLESTVGLVALTVTDEAVGLEGLACNEVVEVRRRWLSKILS